MKIFFLLLIPLLFFSCRNENISELNKQNENLKNQINKLNRSNDSLRNIIFNKYIFDTTEVRIIPSRSNYKKSDSIFEGEFVVIGYNKNDYAKLRKSRIDPIDSIINENGGYKFSINRTLNDTMVVYFNLDSKYYSRNLDYVMSIPYSIIK